MDKICHRRCSVFLVIFFNYISLNAQSITNYSGLKNVDLIKYTCSADDVQKQIRSELPGAGLPAWGADQMPGRSTTVNSIVERVSILEDRAGEIKGEIYFSDFEGGKVTVVVLNSKGDEQKQITPQIIPVNGTSGMLEMDLKISSSVAQGFYLRSSYLRIVYSPASHSKERLYCFELPKRWRLLPENENIIVNIKPIPYKTAKDIINYSASLPIPGANPAPVILAQPQSPPVQAAPVPSNSQPIQAKAHKRFTNAQKNYSSGSTQSPTESIHKFSNEKLFSDREFNKTGDNSPKPAPVATPSINVEPEGPSNQNMINLFKSIKSDYEFNSPSEISYISLDEIYSDKNSASGKYYCKPGSYSLAWNSDDGYKFNMLYGSTNSNGDGQVNMIASLNSNITNTEYDFIKTTLASFLKGKTFTDLEISPPNDPKVTIKDNLARFNIPPDKCSATVPSSIYDPINISWTATTDATNFMITALKENSDIGGELTYKSENNAVLFSIPMKLKIADKSTFGRFELDPETWREKVWQNQTPFSVKLKNIHVFIMNSSNGAPVPCIYTWSLGSPIVLSKSKVKFDSQLVPKWIDDKSKVTRMWMEYEVVPCAECTQEISDMLSSGTSSGRQKSVKFHSMGLLDYYGATFLKVKVRSRYLDPKGKATMEKTIIINRDRQDYDVGPFYVWNEKDLSFEYKLSFLTDDKTFEGTSWIGTKDLEIYMNKITAEKSMGSNLPKPKK